MAVGRQGVHDGYGVFVGLDVGKEGHHAVALNPEGKRLHDATLPNTEAGLRRLSTSSAGTAGSWPWSTSPPRLARCPSRSLARAGIRWPTCPVWSCAGWPTCTPAPRRPTP